MPTAQRVCELSAPGGKTCSFRSPHPPARSQNAHRQQSHDEFSQSNLRLRPCNSILDGDAARFNWLPRSLVQSWGTTTAKPS